MSVEVGSPAPDFTLPGSGGEPVTLSDLRGRTVVLNFFPLAFSGVCTTQFTDIASGAAPYVGGDATVLGVSVDHANSQAAFARETGADAVVFLSDFQPRGAVARAYGVFSEERGHSIRASFVIDAEGVVRHIEIPPTPLQIPDGDAVMAAVGACAVR